MGYGIFELLFSAPSLLLLFNPERYMSVLTVTYTLSQLFLVLGMTFFIATFFHFHFPKLRKRSIIVLLILDLLIFVTILIYPVELTRSVEGVISTNFVYPIRPIIQSTKGIISALSTILPGTAQCGAGCDLLSAASRTTGCGPASSVGFERARALLPGGRPHRPGRGRLSPPRARGHLVARRRPASPGGSGPHHSGTPVAR